MKLTAQEEYGLRCLLQIARQPEEFSTIEEIASREGLTPTHVAKLLCVMRKAGLVTSIRGRKGGFRLGRSADQIQVGTVLGALGGRLYGEDFCKSHTGRKRVCVHDTDCSIRSLWVAIDALVQGALSRIRLKDLLGTERQMSTSCRSNLQELAVGEAASFTAPCSGISRPVS